MPVDLPGHNVNVAHGSEIVNVASVMLMHQTCL